MAENAEDMEELRKRFLKCDVCMCSFDEQLRLPKALPCQHSLCSTCLATLTKGTTVVCPVCQTKHEMDKEMGFPKDKTRRELMEFVKQRSTDGHCEQCKDNGDMIEATFLCTDCNDTLCKDCTAAHKRTRITSAHKLVPLADNSPLLARRPSPVAPTTEGQMCGVQGHENQPLDQYCSASTCRTRVCKLCTQGTHKTHQVVRVSRANIEYQTALKEEIDKQKGRLETIDDMINEASRANYEITANRTACEDEIIEKFGKYEAILNDRKKVLLSDVQVVCLEKAVTNKAKLDELHANKHDIHNLISYAETAVANAEPSSFLEVEPTIRGTIEAILNRTNDSRLVLASPEVVFYADEHTMAYLAGIGNVADGPPASSQETDGNRPKLNSMASSESSTADPGQLMFEEHKMELLKLTPRGFDKHPHGVSRQESLARNRPIQPDTFIIIDLKRQKKNKPNSLDHVPNVRDTSVAKCRLLVYDSAHLRLQVMRRLTTWSLIGYWETSGNDVIMYGRSEDEAEKGLQLLREAVVESAITVIPHCMFLLESDKWQILKVELQQTRYPQQVMLDVFHDSCQVVCYATNNSILQDAVDFVRLFLRDNDVKTATLTYTDVNVNTLQKNSSKELKSICTSLSHFCVDIQIYDGMGTGQVHVKGIGIGFGHALLKLNELVGRCLATSDHEDDELRFSSDESDDNVSEADESRFGEETLANVPQTPDLVIKGMDAFSCNAICMAGGTTLLFTMSGDITELPVEGIVNSADRTLRHTGGLAKAIVKKGGNVIQQQCTEHVRTAGRLAPGDVYCSTAGTLPFAAIIHAVSPKWKGGGHNEEKFLHDAVYKILTESNKRKITSLAIPTLGAGTYAYPPDLAATCIVNTIADFINDYPYTCHREIYLVDINPETAPFFVKAMAEIFGEKYTICFSHPGETGNQTGATAGQTANRTLATSGQTGNQPEHSLASAQVQRVLSNQFMKRM